MQALAVWRAVRGLLLPRVCPVCRSRLMEDQVAHPCCLACADELRLSDGPRCQGCGGPLDNTLACCSECLEHPKRAWVQAVSANRYEGRLRELVCRFKYQGDTALAPVLAHLAAESWRRHGSGQPDRIIPVPLHWRRQFSRGYNQAQLLSHELSRELGIPLQMLLRRKRFTHQQARLDFSARQTNVRSSFSLGSGHCVSGLHLLLVDDVLTTGATLDAAARILVANGAAVSVLTIARG